MDSEVPTERLADRSAPRRTDETVVRAAPNRPSDAAERRTTRRRDVGFGERAVADGREVERLEAELERKEEQLRCVTERYEHLLAEKNREIADASDADAADGGSVSDRRTTLRARLARFLSSLR